jgi:hypothetical protein
MSAREHLRAFAGRVPSPQTSLEAAWIARHLWERWPARRPPRALRLTRRPEATAEQWNGLRTKLEASRVELLAAHVDIVIEWAETTATVAVCLDGQGGRQLDIFEVLDLVALERQEATS